MLSRLFYKLTLAQMTVIAVVCYFLIMLVFSFTALAISFLPKIAPIMPLVGLIMYLGFHFGFFFLYGYLIALRAIVNKTREAVLRSLILSLALLLVMTIVSALSHRGISIEQVFTEYALWFYCLTMVIMQMILSGLGGWLASRRSTTRPLTT